MLKRWKEIQLEKAPGWSIGCSDDLEEYAVGIDQSPTPDGKARGYIKSTVTAPTGCAALMQCINGVGYRRTRICVSGFLKVDSVEYGAGLWVRAASNDHPPISIVNMSSKQFKGNQDWEQHEVFMDVPDNAAQIFFGAWQEGAGQTWVSDVRFVIVDDGCETPNNARELPVNLELNYIRV
jgi:hypothetical protein